MLKRFVLMALAVVCLVFSACSSANDHNLKLVADGKDSKDYIYFDDQRVVYVVGGIMMTETADGESVMLETALYDGTVSLDEILASAKEDADDGDVEMSEYPDGSVEYYYDTFTLISLNKDGIRDVYFVPSDVNYYSVTN